LDEDASKAEQAQRAKALKIWDDRQKETLTLKARLAKENQDLWRHRLSRVPQGDRVYERDAMEVDVYSAQTVADLEMNLRYWRIQEIAADEATPHHARMVAKWIDEEEEKDRHIWSAPPTSGFPPPAPHTPVPLTPVPAAAAAAAAARKKDLGLLRNWGKGTVPRPSAKGPASVPEKK